MDFQNSTFPIVIYGCLDTKSRKPVWIEVWDGNSSPYLIACSYFDYLYESKLLTYYMLELTREQRHTMHAYSRRQQCDIDTDYEVCETVIYRPYSCNQASIRRFYISFKQTWKQKTLHDLFFCTGPINSALTVFLFIKISKKWLLWVKKKNDKHQTNSQMINWSPLILSFFKRIFLIAYFHLDRALVEGATRKTGKVLQRRSQKTTQCLPVLSLS